MHMQHIAKNTSIIAFSNSYKNVNDKSAIRESVLARNAVTISSVKQP